MDCLGDRPAIRIVSKDGQRIASILTLSFKDSLVRTLIDMVMAQPVLKAGHQTCGKAS
jgi:hypothetical protein